MEGMDNVAMYKIITDTDLSLEEKIDRASDVFSKNTVLNLAFDTRGYNVSHLIQGIIKNTPSIVTVYTTGVLIGDEGAIVLAEMLKHNATVVNLILKHSGIGSDGTRALADALKDNATLRHLDLSKCDIGNAGAGHLAEMLKCNSTLTSLRIRGCGIGDEGAYLIEYAIGNNSSLKVLCIEYLSSCERGGSAVMGIMNINSSIEKLDIDCNMLDPDSLDCLFRSIKTASPLKKLRLHIDSITGPSGIERLNAAMEDGLSVNRSLTHLDMKMSTPIESSSLYIMLDTLKVNCTLQEINGWHPCIYAGGPDNIPTEAQKKTLGLYNEMNSLLSRNKDLATSVRHMKGIHVS